MRKFAILAAAAVVCAWDAPGGAPLRWAFIGDSITRIGFPDSLKKKMLAPADLILNAGDDGTTASRGPKGGVPGSDNPYWEDHKFGVRNLDTIRNFKPNIVTIQLGTNDSRDVNWANVSSHFARDYGDLADTALALPSHPAVYLCLPTPAFNRNFGINDSILKRFIVPAIDSIGKAKHLRVFDFRTPLLKQDSLFYDGIHPKGGNPYGSGIIPGGGNDTLAALMFRAYQSVPTRAGIHGPSRKPDAGAALWGAWAFPMGASRGIDAQGRQRGPVRP
jgi:acyl-CoA thioesterase-1